MASKQEKKKVISSVSDTPASSAGFQIKYPLLILGVIVMLLYMGSLSFGFTELDDTIFIKETHAYNEDLSNLTHSFQRGVFSETNDTYFRPLLLDSFIINNALSDTEVKGYHAMNLFFHLLAVLLIFGVFRRLGIDQLKSFLLTLIFAVHPVLSQAVVWIPGRNDTLLAIFAFAFMIYSLDYINKGGVKYLILQFIFLLAALFTKETAVFIAPAFLILCISCLQFNWKEMKQLRMYAIWFAALLIWIGVRSMATLKNDPIQLGTLFKNLPMRLSLSVQYLGKVLLPFNLSVFPMLNETSYLFGIAAILLLAVLIYFAKERNNKIWIGGLLWFLFLLAPLFVLPSALNDQDFEHRLYLPIIGLLIMLSQTALFKNLKASMMTIVVVSICSVFAVINYMHQQSFESPLSFWTEAVRTTPNSSYANMMLGARMKEQDAQQGEALMWKAYAINPKEKYVNYYLGQNFLNKNQLDSAEKFLMNEMKTSAYFETPFLLSRVEILKKDTMLSLKYMADYLEKDPSNSQAINNYVLMLTQTNQWQKAKEFVAKKQAEQIAIPSELIKLANQNQ